MSPLSFRPVVAMAAVWRQVKPRPDADEGSRALVAALREGRSLGDALAVAAPRLAQVAVSEAGRAFHGGPLALFIVDVRDSLRRQVQVAGRLSQDLSMRMALERASRRVDDDTFVQHLINTLLESTSLYTESMPLEVIPEARCARDVAALFTRALSTLISPNDRARRLGERTTAMEFVPMPSPSAPR
jgi:hypothetical protein